MPVNDKVVKEFKPLFLHICLAHLIGVWDTVSSLVMNPEKRWHSIYLNPEFSSHGGHAVIIFDKRKDSST